MLNDLITSGDWLPLVFAFLMGFSMLVYALLDGYVTWKPTENVEINFGVQNIFDTAYFPNTLTGYANTASDSVAAQNPLELQVAPGRTFKIGATVKF